MGSPRVYADPQKTDDDGRLLLVCTGTHEDLTRYEISLREGLSLNFWADDEDEDGNADPLVFTGTVQYNPAESSWVAEIDGDGFRHLSDTRK
jgi:hypothetical protein